eukprot:scaffold35056_cov101-Isochrysis_galbana.AAC.2
MSGSNGSSPSASRSSGRQSVENGTRFGTAAGVTNGSGAINSNRSTPYEKTSLRFLHGSAGSSLPREMSSGAIYLGAPAWLGPMPACPAGASWPVV